MRGVRVSAMVLDRDPIWSAEQIKIPDDLGDIIKEYCKEVIRENPANIMEFSAKYFEGLSSGGGSDLPSLDQLAAFVAAMSTGEPTVPVSSVEPVCSSCGIGPSMVAQAMR